MTTPSTQFGAIVGGAQVDNAVRDVITEWMPTYLPEIGAQSGYDRDGLPPFRSVVARSTFARAAEDQLPACIIISPGTTGQTERRSNKISAWWSMGLAVVVSGRDEQSTYALARVYAAAVRGVMLQQAPGNPPIEAVTWVGELYDEFMDTTRHRSIAIGTGHFRVRVDSTINPYIGPTQPNPTPITPLPDWGTVESTSVTVENEG